MPKKSLLDPTHDKERDRWKVNVPAGLSTTGKRVRSWHPTRDAARKYIDKITAQENPAATIPPTLAIEADKARGILEPLGLDLVQAAREIAAAREVLAGTGSIMDAAKAFRANHEAKVASKRFGDAVAVYLDSRSDLRDATQRSYKYTLEKVLGAVLDKLIADIRTEELEAALASRAPTARAMHRRNLRTFWKWACAPPRQWGSMVAVNALEAVRISHDSDISILSPDDVAALMRASEKESPAAAAAYAIAIFGGVRMGELEKLTWGDVGAENIEIGKSIAKRHSRRLVPICPTLKAWMDATRGAAKKTDPVVPPNWTDVSKSARRRAGWNVAARLLSNPPEPTRGEWPTNACRHTCASVQVAVGTPLEELTFKFGHSGGHDLLRKHYVSRLTKKDALAILGIGPNGTIVESLAAV